MLQDLLNALKKNRKNSVQETVQKTSLGGMMLENRIKIIEEKLIIKRKSGRLSMLELIAAERGELNVNCGVNMSLKDLKESIRKENEACQSKDERIEKDEKEWKKQQ